MPARPAKTSAQTSTPANVPRSARDLHQSCTGATARSPIQMAWLACRTTRAKSASGASENERAQPTLRLLVPKRRVPSKRRHQKKRSGWIRPSIEASPSTTFHAQLVSCPGRMHHWKWLSSGADGEWIPTSCQVPPSTPRQICYCRSQGKGRRRLRRSGRGHLPNGLRHTHQS